MATANLSLGEAAQADFAVNLLREAVNADQGKSVIISPLSVAIALSMAYAGAKDETADEIANMIAKGQSSGKIHEYFGAMIQKIASNEPKNYTLETANRIYVKQGFPLLQSYKDLLNDHYLGQFQSVDFTKSAQTAKTINDFVAEKTHNKIKDLIQESSLDALTRLVLINAIYFKGNWASKFDAKKTEKKSFYQSESNEIQVDMMQKQKEKFFYDETETYQVLGMPYEGNEIFMFIVLPKERHGLKAVLEGLNGPALLKIVKNRKRNDVVVSIPKFKLESTHNLVSPLKKLGMEKAFIGGQANFTGITDSPDAKDLYISDVIQKAFIETNEEGSEAAAATAAQIEQRSMAPTAKVFKADHPFAFSIVGSDGILLFGGVVRGSA